MSPGGASVSFSCPANRPKHSGLCCFESAHPLRCGGPAAALVRLGCFQENREHSTLGSLSAILRFIENSCQRRQGYSKKKNTGQTIDRIAT